MKTDKRVLVTGGAGYIGCNVVGRLLERGYNVSVLDSLIFGDEAISEHKGNPNFELIEGDIRHIEDLVKAIKGVPNVIHLAAIVGDPACGLNPEATRTVNCEATKALMEICKFYRVRKILFASSCSVYGASKEITLNEGSYLNPVSLYAETRIESEEVILESAKRSVFDFEGGICPTILRLGTIYGYSKRMRFDLVVNILTAKAVTEKKITVYGGDQYRPLVNVQDAAGAFLACLEAPREKVNRQIFNVGSNDQNFKISGIGDMVKECIPEAELVTIEHKEDDRDYKVSFDKINHLIGYHASRKICDSILEIKKMLDNGEVRDWREDRYYNSRYEYI